MDNRLTLEENEKYLIEWREFYDENALEKLFNGYEGLIKYIAQKYLDKGLTYEELVSAGIEGFFNGINKFNYIDNNINSFSSYVGTAIENSIRYELKKYRKHSHVLSFEQPIGQNDEGDELTLEDIIESDDEELIEDIISNMKNEIVRDALNCLTSREKQIILLRYGLDDEHSKTQEEVAQIFNCSQTMIVKQEQKALIKMRHPKNTKKIKDFID